MKTLLKNLHVVYPGTEWNGKKWNILLNDGVIEQVSEHPIEASGAEELDGEELIGIPGLVDAQCTVGEPGYEDKESLGTLTAAAKAGGFSDVMVLPHTLPVVDTSAQVSYIQKHGKAPGINVHPYAAITKELKGKELAEMYDMHSVGAIAFSDAKHPVADVNMMKRALEYAKGFGGLVCSFPYDERLNPGGYMHEGPVSTSMGVKSTPALAEELMLNRDLYLLEYTKSKLHVSTVSSEGSLNLIREARAKGLDVTCGVALPNLLYTDEQLTGFDTNYKTNPPLRDEAHRQALIQALKDGTIDMIVTDHSPEVIENKAVELDHAAHGMTMLETALPLAYQELKDALGLDKLVEVMALNPRKRFGLEMPALAPGAEFSFTLFSPDETWHYSTDNARSRAHNSPNLNTQLTGKVISLTH